ncbi:MAG: HPr family phosphocarrier protein [Angelakisella sp.]|nr:HPr family phosphocarrier protein [Angelakisella sp.]
MMTKDIQLTTVERVKDFVNAVSEFDFEVDLISGRYHVNGKSIMGIFSLDLTRSIQLEAEVPAAQEATFAQAIEPFLL